MAATLTLNFHELLWYLQGGMSGSHLRWSIYEDFVNKVYPQLSDDERESIYTYAKRDLSWHFEGNHVDETAHEYFKRVLACFNPSNRYKITLKNDKKKETVDAYLFDGLYYINWNRYCAPEYILEIKQQRYRTCDNDLCEAKTHCKRFVEHQKGDKTVLTSNVRYDKCELLIKTEQ